MFNIQGSEMIFLLLVALIILGPEKLPDAVRKFGRLYGEFKKMANGFQGEIRSALDEPMRELRDTANLVREAARFDIMGSGPQADTVPEPGSAVPAVPGSAVPATPVATEPGLNFGSAHPRVEVRPPRIVPADDVAPEAPNEAAGDPA